MMHPLLPKLDDLTTDEVLEKINSLHQKINFARRTNNQAMMVQLLQVMQGYQEEFQKRRQAEIKQAEENPIFKNSLDIG